MADQPSSAAAHVVLDAALGVVGAEQRVVNAAAGRRTVALGRAVAASQVDPGMMLDLDVERVASASRARRDRLVDRALVAEVACIAGVGEEAATTLLSDARVLTTTATGTLDLLCAGAISYRHAAKLAAAVEDLSASAVAEVERVVLPRAPEQTAAKFGALVQNARDMLHPVPAEVRAEAARLKANVWLDDGKDGMSWLTAHMPTPAARAAYDRINRTVAKAKAAGDPRGVGQLRADTLTALLLDDEAAKAGAESSTGSRGRRSTGPGAIESSTTDRGEPGRPPGPTDVGDPPGSLDPPEPVEEPDAPDVPDPLEVLARSIRPVLHVTVPVTTLTGASEGSGVLDGVVPVDAESARRLAASAPTLRRVLTDPVTGAMLTLDRRTYAVPADLRAFLTARDVTCRFPGCRIPARRCDADHTIAWADGGATDATNLALLCRKHHTMKHESRWQVEQLPDGVLAWTSPRGHTHLTTPGVADQVVGQLDQAAIEAGYLADEPADMAAAGATDGAVVEPVDNSPQPAALPSDAADPTDDAPPF